LLVKSPTTAKYGGFFCVKTLLRRFTVSLGDPVRSFPRGFFSSALMDTGRLRVFLSRLTGLSGLPDLEGVTASLFYTHFLG